MDRMEACGAFDRGSNPLGRTGIVCSTFTLLKHRKGVIKMNEKEQRQQIASPATEESDKGLADKALKNKIKAIEKAVLRLVRKYPEKSRLQLLRRIRIDLGAFAEWLEIARIERNQENRLTADDRIFVAEEKRFLLENRPELEKILTNL